MADRKISDLTALTTPASGDYLPIVDISEASAANKNKRITIEELLRGAPDGTAGAPGIGFESDPNTGIYSPGADALGLVTAGTERLRITSAGLVGIGTSAPGNNCEIYVGTPSNNDAGITLTNGNNLGFGTSLSFSHRATNGGAIATRSYISSEGGSDNSFLRFATTIGGTLAERVRIDEAGRVGIGTTSPRTTLDVASASSTAAYIGGTGNYSLRLGHDNTSASITSINSGTAYTDLTLNALNTVFATGSASLNERARIDSSGRLLVGTSSDSGGALFQVNGNRIRVATAKTPSSASDTGTAGEICWDADYIYVCTATNTWKRTAISTWP